MIRATAISMRHDVFHQGPGRVDKDTTGQFLLNTGTRRTQYGALCWRMFKGSLQILLITSRDTGRWVIPKGWPIPGQTPEGSAGREAWEEAGVEGRIDPGCIGLYDYEKVMTPTQTLPCIVAVYPLKVSRLRKRYQESHERRRRWFAPEKAAKKVDEPQLRDLLARFVPPPAGVAALPVSLPPTPPGD
jgi:8-oxo-dGTP pyrophosphatase MutT (NUDIX family)